MRLRRRKPYRRPFKPTHQLPNGVPVEILGKPWRLYPQSSPRQTVILPNGRAYPAPAQYVGRLVDVT